MIHKSVSLADQVFERLESEILTGKYARGDILTETGLTSELGVSRTPVREALRRLEQEHLVEETGKGTIVLGITPDDAGNMYLIRIRIEGLAAAACARSASDESVQRLLELVDLQEFYVEKKNSEKIKELDSEFHRCIYKFSGSVVLFDTLMPLHNKLQKFRKKSIEDNGRAAASATEHRKIAQAIAQRDEKAAEELMTAHVRAARQHLVDAGII